MSNFKKITLYLPNKVSEYLEKLPRGFRRPFLEALILEAQERFTNSEEIAQFVMQHPNLFFKNLHAKESKIDVKEKEKASTCRKKEGKQEEHSKDDVSKLDKMEGFF